MVRRRSSWRAGWHPEREYRSVHAFRASRHQRDAKSGIVMKFSKDALSSAALLALSVVFALVIGEGILRIKNSSMQNYDIEMWRYARELKIKSSDPALDFEHLKSKSAVL